MLQTVGKFGLVIALSTMGLLGLGWIIYAIVGGVVMLTTAIVITQGLQHVERRAQLVTTKYYDLKLEMLYTAAFAVAFGAVWPALPLIAVFGTDDTDAPQDPSGPRAR